jgi:hypothetical protein
VNQSVRLVAHFDARGRGIAYQQNVASEKDSHGRDGGRFAGRSDGISTTCAAAEYETQQTNDCHDPDFSHSRRRARGIVAASTEA